MKRRNLLLVMTVLILCSGCRYDERTEEPGEAVEGSSENAQGQEKDGTAEETEALAEGYRAFYEEAAEKGREDSLELKQAIADYLGREGYAASDRDDQINMTNYQQAEEFCRKAQMKEAAELTLFSVLDEGKLIRYDMDGPPGRIGFRIAPLDERCRELNRKYVLPTGYTRNNLLITDWNEELESVWYSPRLTDEEWDTWYGEHAGY